VFLEYAVSGAVMIAIHRSGGGEPHRVTMSDEVDLALVQARDLVRRYGEGATEVLALRGVSLDVLQASSSQ
jgi:hypothetical protein